MIAPRGLVGAALVAWGFAIGLPAAGIALGLAFEGLRSTRLRVSLSDAAMAHVLRITFFVAIAAFAASISLQRAPQSVYSWLRWLPVMLAALPFLQVLNEEGLSVAALRHSVRFGGEPMPDPRAWDATHGYALCCVVAAGTAGSAEGWYYAAAFLLVAWGLVARMRRRRLAGVVLLACAATLGLGVSTGLFKLQAQLEEWGEELLEDLFTPDPDPFRERTRIGDMGRVKLNDRILMRVAPEGPRPMQVLLRESGFDAYRSGVWESSRRAMRAVPREGEAWRLRPGDGSQRLVLRRSFVRGEGLLPLPAGTTSIEKLDAATVETMDTGSVRAKGMPGPVEMRVSYEEALDATPVREDADLEVPGNLRPVLDEIVSSSKLRGASAKATVAAVERYFGTGFAYSLQLSSATRASRSIADFLLHDRKGHCEYFATATVLLLRDAGVPARYVVGYSAQEYSALEKAFIVRNRHAHAWAQALVDGRWVTVDTTPANWAEEEAQAAHTAFGALVDVLSWAWEGLQRFWAASNAWQLAGIGAALAFLAALPWLIHRLPRLRSSKPRAAPPDRIALAWREIESLIAARGFARAPRETVRDWVRRLASEPAAQPWHASFAELADLYYRIRFDPAAPAELHDRFLRGQTPGSDPGV